MDAVHGELNAESAATDVAATPMQNQNARPGGILGPRLLGTLLVAMSVTLHSNDLQHWKLTLTEAANRRSCAREQVLQVVLAP
jgi:hypothetical protein